MLNDDTFTVVCRGLMNSVPKSYNIDIYARTIGTENDLQRLKDNNIHIAFFDSSSKPDSDSECLRFACWIYCEDVQ